MDVNKLINGAIAAVISESDEKSVGNAVDNTKKFVKELQTGERNVQNAGGHIAKTGAGKFVKELETGERNVQNVPGHVKKFVDEVKSGERNLSNVPDNVKDYLDDIDVGKTSALAAAAIAAGLGGVAAIKRLRKSSKK